MIYLLIIIALIIAISLTNHLLIGDNNDLVNNLKKFEENERKYKSSNK
jgi:hypothetical protein